MTYKINRWLIYLNAIFIVACSSEPSGTQSSVPAIKEQSQSQTSGTTIAAFLRGSASDQEARKAFERGMELAAESQTPATMNLNFLDSADGAPDSARLKSLLSKVPLVVYWQTSDLTLAAPVLKQSEVIAVPVWNVTKKVASLGNKVFGFGYSTQRSFAEYAKLAGKNLKSYRFAVLSASTEPFATQSKEFIEESKSQGNTIVFEEKADSASTDFKGLVTRAIKEKCDTIFAVLPSDSLVKFIIAARQASFTGKILVGDSLFSAELKALGKDAEGIYLVQAWSDDAALKTKYSSKYGAEPDGVTLGAAALGYDLIKCIEAAGSNPKPSDISYSWLSTPCQGLTGKTQFSGERIALRQKRVLTVKDGKFEPLS